MHLDKGNEEAAEIILDWLGNKGLCPTRKEGEIGNLQSVSSNEHFNFERAVRDGLADRHGPRRYSYGRSRLTRLPASAVLS